MRNFVARLCRRWLSGGAIRERHPLALPSRSVLRRLGLDAALWYCLPVPFAFLYARGRTGAVAGALLHLLVIALPLIAILLARLLIARVVSDARLSRLISSALTASVLVMMLFYYAVVLVGLSSWGGVFSWDAVPIFLSEAPELADIMGFPRYLVPSLAALICAAIFALTWRYLERFDWAAAASRWLDRSTWVMIVGGGLSGLTVGCYALASGAGTNELEPVSMTLFPKAGDVVDLEGHAIDRLKASIQDRLEDAARAANPPPVMPRRKQWIELGKQQVDFEGHVVELAAAGTQDRTDDTARADYVAANRRSPPNLVLIVVDALRPDHMGVYGYDRDTTPNLSSLARTREARVVRGVHASCGDTICGLLSMSSSKFPRNFSLHPITLHEVLRRNGYRLHLILTGDHSYFYSLKGFYGEVDEYFDGTQARGYFINDDQLALDHLEQAPVFDGTPTMFQFHVMASHVLRPRAKTPGKFQPATSYVIHSAKDIGANSISEASATNFYDNGVVRSDEVIAGFLATLKHKGYLKKALVVITADHGEALGEHGMFVHANSVREQLLRIPLLLIAYGYHPQPLIPRAVPAQVDIAPTILAELGIPRPTTWAGHPLQESVEGQFVYFEEHENSGVIDSRDPLNTWKYWLDSRSGAEHAFNLSVDPDENHDAIAEVPAPLRAEWRVRTGSVVRTSSAH